MAINDLKDLNTEWVVMGLLFFALMSFTLTFFFNNSPDALGDTQGSFENFEQQLEVKLIETEANGNSLLNISSQNNPEVSDLGSKDSVATGFGAYGNAKSFITQTKLFFSWIFAGNAGSVLITVFVSLLSFTAIFLIIKSIRNGL